MVCRTVSTLPIVERLVASRMMEYQLLQPWLHAAFVALLLCLGVLVGASLATGRAPRRLRLQRPVGGGVR